MTVARFGNKRPKRLVLAMRVLPNRSGVRKSSDNVKLTSESKYYEKGPFVAPPELLEALSEVVPV